MKRILNKKILNQKQKRVKRKYEPYKGRYFVNAHEKHSVTICLWKLKFIFYRNS